MTIHVPILVAPILEGLIAPFRALPPESPPQWLVDCTLGGGGHTQSFLDALAADPRLRRHRVLSVDQDPSAVARGRERFAREIAEGRLEIFQSRFGALAPELQNRPVLGLLADLGFSSDQLEDSERGLSFQGDGPLDMRLDPTQGWTARDFIAQSSENEIEKVLREYGEERFSKRIAAAIVRQRRETHAPRTTRELAELVLRAVPPPARHGRIHAATRTFQALRIVINGEMEELDALLERVILSVVPGGRVAILSFHSLEDRKVKFAFKGTEFEPLTKKPVEADQTELEMNPRSRSAKLRIGERKRI